MGSDKRIPCSTETFDTLHELKESRGDTWDQLLLWLYEDARDDPLDNNSVDADEVAQVVVERLEGSKPLEDMAFDDWFEPNHGQTVAVKIVEELDNMDLAFDEPEPLTESDVQRIVKNQLNDLETELTRQHEDMGGR